MAVHWRECRYAQSIAPQNLATATISAEELEAHLREGKPPVAPTLCRACVTTEVGAILDRVRAVPYQTPIRLAPGVRAGLLDAGHIPCSASIVVEVELDGKRRRVLFSGDLGSDLSAAIAGPRPAPNVDAVFVEATYGTTRRGPDVARQRELFRRRVGEAVARRSVVWIPCFALDRTQRILYELRLAQEEGALPEPLPIYCPSPTANEITAIYRENRRANIRSERQVRDVVNEAAGGGALLLYSLVSARLRRLVLEESRRNDIDSLDVLGPVLERLATHLSLMPQEKPGLFRQLLEARDRVIEAVDFAFHHDDGQNVDDLQRAEVVLVGVSRAMKTPTMLYLAYRGWFAANVPLILDMAPPEPLLAVPAHRVVYLRVSPDRLVELRRVRAERTGIPVESYATLQRVRCELDYSRELVRKHGWLTVDVTGKSVEEASREIIALLSPPKE